MNIFSLIFNKDIDSLSFEEKKKRYLYVMVFIFLVFLIGTVIAYFFVDVLSISVLFFGFILIFYFNRKYMDLLSEYNQLHTIRGRLFVTTIVLLVVWVIIIMCF